MSEDPRIEKVARAMAMATEGYEEHPPGLAAPGARMSGSVGMSYSGTPAWEKHLGEAKRFVAAYGALIESEARDGDVS
jgi:hypothetical protein